MASAIVRLISLSMVRSIRPPRRGEPDTRVSTKMEKTNRKGKREDLERHVGEAYNNKLSN